MKGSGIVNKRLKQQCGHLHWNKKGPLEAVIVLVNLTV